MSHIIVNGQAVRTDQPSIPHTNRAFRYGDGLFETFLCKGTEPFFFEAHYNRLLQAAQSLRIDTPLLPSIDSFKRQIALLISKKKYPPYSRIRITVFRADGGLYTPASNAPGWIIDHQPYTDKPFTLNTRGLLTGIFNDIKKYPSPISRFKSCSSQLFVMAGLTKMDNNWDDILICNTEGKIIEGLSSNLFMVKDGNVYTPSVSAGCVDGIMRNHIIGLCANKGIKVVETEGASIDDIKLADEMFLTNSVQGIKWILGVDQKRFYLKLASSLAEELKTMVL